MRNFTRYFVVATLMISVPAAAQDNTVTAANDTAAADPGLGTTNNLDSDAAVATAPMNGLTAGSPATADPGAVDLSYGNTGETQRRDDGRFPWGLLGLLGLAGLIPRKPRSRTS